MDRVVVVGASLAGLHAAETLRLFGFDGEVLLVGAEEQPPYDRPPLSKQVLQGTLVPDLTAMRTPADYADQAIELLLGQPAVGLDVPERLVELADGTRVQYDGLVIATGATPRRLRGQPDIEGIHVLRTLDDCAAIARACGGGARTVVVGGGFIGLEVASSCRARGLDVTIVEALPTPLAGVLGEQLGSVCGEMHRDHGVAVRCGVGVEGFDGSGRVESVCLSDGSTIEADLVVVGVGVRPATDWLDGSGLALEDGVVCDATCSAGPPGVVAAGDVARWYNPLFDVTMRVEHWTNAVEQGGAAARRLLAGDAGTCDPFAPVPFVWSDQYDCSIQMYGLIAPDRPWTVVHGALEARSFVAIQESRGVVTAAVGIGQAVLLKRYSRLIRERVSVERAVALASTPTS